MNWLVYHIVSGQAYFSGGILLLVAAVVSARQHCMAQRVSVLLAFLGSLAVAISATPVSNGVYAVGAVVMLVWLVSQAKTGISSGRWDVVISLRRISTRIMGERFFKKTDFSVVHLGLQ